jgi:hypothetical protein
MAIYGTDYTLGTIDGKISSIATDLFNSTDNDVFKFDIPTLGANWKYTIQIFLDNKSTSDIDLELYRDNGDGILNTTVDTFLRNSRRAGNADEAIEYNTTASGTYFARVYAYDTFTTPRNFSIDIVGLLYGSGVDLPYYNPPSFIIAPTSLDQGRPFWSSLLAPVGLKGSVDTLEFNASQAGLMGISIHYFTPGGNARINVFDDSNNNGVFDSQDQLLKTETDKNFFNVQVDQGTFFAQVENELTSSNNYEVTLFYDFMTTPVYRLYNSINGAHLYTTSPGERDAVLQNLPHFQYEGIAMQAATEQGDPLLAPVYRLYNSINGAHLYTTSTLERDSVLQSLPHFQNEGIAFYAYKTDENYSRPLDEYDAVLGTAYRMYNTLNGAHLYTLSDAERNGVLANLPHFNNETPTFQTKFSGL